MAEDSHSTSVEHLRGSVKEALGKLTGDSRIEAEGRRRKRGAPSSRVGRSKPHGQDGG